MRPPRPCPSWRRARSALRSSARSSKPACSPSTIAVRPGPWDSPAVTRRTIMSALAYLCSGSVVGDVDENALGGGEVQVLEHCRSELVHERGARAIAAIQARGGGRGGLPLRDAHDLQLVSRVLPVGCDVIEFLGLTGGEHDGFALRVARHAAAFAFEDRFADQGEDCAL